MSLQASESLASPQRQQMMEPISSTCDGVFHNMGTCPREAGLSPAIHPPLATKQLSDNNDFQILLTQAGFYYCYPELVAYQKQLIIMVSHVDESQETVALCQRMVVL